LTNQRHILSVIFTLLALNIFAQSNFNALDFVENKGQWDKKVNYKGDFGNGAFFLRFNPGKRSVDRSLAR